MVFICEWAERQIAFCCEVSQHPVNKVQGLRRSLVHPFIRVRACVCDESGFDTDVCAAPQGRPCQCRRADLSKHTWTGACVLRVNSISDPCCQKGQLVETSPHFKSMEMCVKL